MPRIPHHNLANTDDQVYCCLRNKVVKLDERQKQDFCGKCPMFGGWLASGVICEWKDARQLTDPYTVADPMQEFKDNQKRQVHLALTS